MKTISETNQAQSQQQIYLDQIKHLYSNAQLGLITTFINSIILAYVLWPVVARNSLMIWLSLLLGITTLRYILIFRHRSTQHSEGYSPAIWGSMFTLGMALSGLSWGSVALFAFPVSHPEYQIFIAFVVGGMVAGASSSMVSLFSGVLLFNIFAMLPLIGRFLYEGSQIQYAMGVMLVLFLLMMLIFARRGRDIFIDSLSLKYEKNALQDVYHQTRHEADTLTSNLQREMSVRELAEASLQESELRLWTIIEHAPFVIYALDKDGYFVLTEGQGLLMQELKHGELIGKSFRDQFSADPRLIEKIEQALVGKNTTYLREYNGRFLDVSCTPLFNDEEKLIGVIGIETDVTDKIKMENIRQDLISTVSHELRTPLTSIIGSLNLIQSGSLNPDQKDKLVEMALRNSQRLIRLVNDILDVDKLSSGNMVFHLAAYSVTELLRQSIDANKHYADKYSVQLKLSMELDDISIYVDDERFLQVMANLVSNAIKYSPKGETVTIHCQTVTKSVPGIASVINKSFIKISVIDRGPGIPHDHRSTIFEKFTQVDAQVSPVQGGTGLGLSIAKSIVEQMGGEIGLEFNEPLGETHFFFLLPEKYAIEENESNEV